MRSARSRRPRPARARAPSGQRGPGGVGDRDRLPGQVLVAGAPRHRQVAAVGAPADDHIDDANDGLGEINLDPDLRLVAGARRLLAEADTALGYEGEAVAALTLDLDD